MSLTKSVLVIGGAGYIGSHTCKALAQNGYTPVVLDNLSKGFERAVKWGPLIQADKADTEALHQAFATHNPIAVIDFAAFIEAGESVKDPATYYHNNVVKGLRFLEAHFETARQTAGNKAIPLVFSSTAAVYGNTERQPIPEQTAKAPINPYGATKLTIEQALEAFVTSYGGSVVALRYFNACGADPDGEIGEDHNPETHLIPLMLQAMAGSNQSFRVFGRDYPTPDGTCIRDYIHVSDLANAHVAAVELAIRSHGYQSFNCGTGVGSSIKQIIEAAERVTGIVLNAQDADRRPGDPAKLVADASALKTATGWQPTHSDLDTIVATAWNWIQSKSVS